MPNGKARSLDPFADMSSQTQSHNLKGIWVPLREFSATPPVYTVHTYTSLSEPRPFFQSCCTLGKWKMSYSFKVVGHRVIYINAGNSSCHHNFPLEWSIQGSGDRVLAQICQLQRIHQLMVIPPVAEGIIEMDILSSWQNHHVDPLTYKVRMIRVGRAKWKPLKLPPPLYSIAKMVNHKHNLTPVELQRLTST